MTKKYNLQSVHQLVREGEGQNLEFKLKANFPEKIVREMVAFANTDGGRLLVGVADDGKVMGVKHAEEEKFMLDRAIRYHSRPVLKFSTQSIPVSDKRTLLLYYIPSSRKKPHYALEHPEQKFGKAYIRVGDQSMQASREMIEVLRGQRMKRGQKISYGEKERALFTHLEKAEKITLEAYCSIAGLSRQVASRILVKLVLSNVLRIVPDHREEYFVFNSHSPY